MGEVLMSALKRVSRKEVSNNYEQVKSQVVEKLTEIDTNVNKQDTN